MQETVGTQPVWAYRGYQLRPNEFAAAMVHSLGAEVRLAHILADRAEAVSQGILQELRRGGPPCPGPGCTPIQCTRPWCVR